MFFFIVIKLKSHESNFNVKNLKFVLDRARERERERERKKEEREIRFYKHKLYEIKFKIQIFGVQIENVNIYLDPNYLFLFGFFCLLCFFFS